MSGTMAVEEGEEVKLHAETSHEIKFRVEPKGDGNGWEASAFIKPHVTVRCGPLWEWLKEKLNIRETEPPVSTSGKAAGREVMDIDKINESLNGLSQAALMFVPNDPVLPYLTTLMPQPVTTENAKTTVIILSLLCRRLATVFNDLAVEQEKLIEQWQNSQR